jgi:hypothetical protein
LLDGPAGSGEASGDGTGFGLGADLSVCAAEFEVTEDIVANRLVWDDTFD